MPKLAIPALLDVPDKLLPVITDFNQYVFFDLDGGRVSAKSHTVARFILYLASIVPNLRIFCGREIQNSIEDSVYALLKDLIKTYNLPYDVGAKTIDHKTNGSKIRFRGFREQGSVNVKGLEGVDILWVDEAQQLSKETIDIIIPTIIRKANARLFFTYNRTLPEDPIYMDMKDRSKCLHIHTDYRDNKHCTQSTIDEALECLKRNEEDYNHIWLGLPRPSATNAAFRNVDYVVDKELPVLQEPSPKFSYTAGIDLAKSVDYTVICVFNNQLKTLVYFERLENENRTSWNYQKEKIRAVCKKYNNALAVIDSTGVGDPIVEDLMRMGVNVYHQQREDSDRATPGVKFTSLSKENIIEKLKVAIETRLIRIPYIKVLIDELKDYRAIRLPSGGIRYSCPDEKDINGNPKHDDCVIALGLAIWGAHDAMYAPDYQEPKERTQADDFWDVVKKDLKKIASADETYTITDEDGESISEN